VKAAIPHSGGQRRESLEFGHISKVGFLEWPLSSNSGNRHCPSDDINVTIANPHRPPPRAP
jgi:hypothetical protein